MRMFLLLLFVAAIASSVSCDLLPTPAEPPNFEPLFDGKTLNSWEGDTRFFRVENSVIIAGRLDAPIPHNEFLASTESFGDFDLRFEARLAGAGHNAGVQFRSERIPDNHEMVGYQCDIGTWSAGLIWGLLYDESRRRRMLDEPEQEPLRKAIDPGGWNRLRVLAIGGPECKSGSTAFKRSTSPKPTHRLNRPGAWACRSTAGFPRNPTIGISASGACKLKRGRGSRRFRPTRP